MALTAEWDRAWASTDVEDSAPSPREEIDTTDAGAGAQVALQAAITEHMGCGVALIRVDDAVIVYANGAFARMLGYDLGKLEGQPISVVNAPTDRAPAEIAQDIIRAVRRNGVWSGRIENLKSCPAEPWGNSEEPCRATGTAAASGTVGTATRLAALSRATASPRIRGHWGSSDLSAPRRVPCSSWPQPRGGLRPLSSSGLVSARDGVGAGVGAVAPSAPCCSRGPSS